MFVNPEAMLNERILPDFISCKLADLKLKVLRIYGKFGPPQFGDFSPLKVIIFVQAVWS